MRRRFAEWLRKIADRVSPDTAPRAIGWAFTHEPGRGLVFREGTGQGCPLWYLGEADYQRSHDESDTEHVVVLWSNVNAGRGPATRKAGGRR